MEEEEAKGVDPDLVTRKPSETRGGVMEKLFKICGECGEEFCHGNCSKFDYEQHKELQFYNKDLSSEYYFQRVDIKVIEFLKEGDTGSNDKTKRKNWPSCKKLSRNKKRK